MPLVRVSSPAQIQLGAQALAAGQLVAFPTETVYGLGARADDDQAVARIFRAKGRPADHPLIVHVASQEAALHFAQTLPSTAQRLMQAFWPGPVTLIVPRRAGVGAAAAGGQTSVGLRMPSHPVALALLHEAAALGVMGVAAPSANRFGRVSPTCAAHVAQEFGALTDLLILDGGDCAVGIESAIVDCTVPANAAPALLRPGTLAAAQLEAVLGRALAQGNDHSPRASGTLAAHYAPQARVQLMPLAHLQDRWQGPPDPKVGVYSWAWPPSGWMHRPMAPDAAAVAHELFAVLRQFDALGLAHIWVQTPPEGAAWAGVLDRLSRAAAAATAIG